MFDGSPLLPLLGASLVLLALIGGLGFAIFKFRRAAREDLEPVHDRLSEEAFAAATIKAALAARGQPADVPGARTGTGGETLDASLLDGLAGGVVATDEAGVVRRVNAAARSALALTGPGTGHPFRATLAAVPALVDAFARVHAGESPVTATLTLASGGEAATHAVTVSRWTPQTGRGGAVALIVRAPETLPPGPSPEATAAASAMTAGLAHELANSLTTVHGYAHLVDRSGLSEADRTALDQIKACAEQMLSTVERFRGILRPLPVSPTVFAPADAMRAAIDLACDEAGVDRGRVRVGVHPSGTVRGDRVLLEEAIAAVVRNALEASALVSPVPPVEVRLAQAAGGGRVEIEIRDRGPGIAADVRHRLFQPFFTDKPGHEGFGLARASHVLRAHAGATIAFLHPADGGVVVTIGLPTLP